LTLILWKVLAFIFSLFKAATWRGYRERFLRYILTLSFAKKKLLSKIQKVEEDIKKEIHKHSHKFTETLPEDPRPMKEIQSMLQELSKRDEGFSTTGKISGCRYGSDKQLELYIKDFAKEFLYHNPLHFDLFPASRQMEAEVISMTSTLYGKEEDPCGIFTSGGTESIMLAMLAYRNWGR